MVFACKNYITEGGLVRIWDVEPAILLQRLASCQKLYQRYQECYLLTKQRVQSTKKPFEISEMYVFGKFTSFCRRLQQLCSLVDTMQQFSVLKDSHLEGIEQFATRFSQLVSVMKKKPYNPLDHRKMEFSVDFEEFQRQVAEMEEQLSAFMAASFTPISSCMQALQLVQR